MKKFFSSLTVIAILCTLTLTSAFAKEKSKTVSFRNDTSVNGTLIKKGTYKVSFNDETNEVSIWNGKEMLVKTTAKVVPTEQTTKQTFLNTTEQNNTRILNGISFEGEKNLIVIDQSANTGANPQ